MHNQPELTLTPQEAIDYVTGMIEYDFKYLKRNTSMQVIDNLPQDVINDLEKLWQSKDCEVTFVTDEAPKEWDKLNEIFVPLRDDKVWMVVKKLPVKEVVNV